LGAKKNTVKHERIRRTGSDRKGEIVHQKDTAVSHSFGVKRVAKNLLGRKRRQWGWRVVRGRGLLERGSDFLGVFTNVRLAAVVRGLSGKFKSPGVCKNELAVKTEGTRR